jgi:phosphonate transport system ATP-binding protein
MLQITNLSKTYGTGEQALRDVDLTMERREFVALLGLSGSGKSTLLRCINRLVEPTSGSVKLDGVEITHLGKKELRRARSTIGMIFQDVNLVDRSSVLENVLSGTLGVANLWKAVIKSFPRAVVERALSLCERVGIAEHITKRADQLSGGQRQRVGIARALMQNPKILLADEPTSSLDPKIGSEVMELIREISEEAGVPVVVSVHDVELARRFSDRIVGMRSGQKIFDRVTKDIEPESIKQIYHQAGDS